MYQLSPHASKTNAFCWLSWELTKSSIGLPTIDWKGTSNATSERQTQLVEAKRAEGVDLAYLPGIGSSAPRDATSIARHAIRTAKETSNAR